MKLSVILTINNRTPEVCKQVADSFKLPGNQPDEMVIVLDRASEEVRMGAVRAFGQPKPGHLVYVDLIGKPGWKGPAKAWNAGFAAATGDLFYCISSEVVQDEGNIDKMRALADDETVVFGSCWNSVKKNIVRDAPHGLLTSSKIPRPLGFIVCMPAKNVREIEGFDEKFMDGFWYDDGDFFYRLWQTGLDFVFDDSVNGVHLDHDRPILNCEEGWAKIEVNKQYTIKKYGTEKPWEQTMLRTISTDGQTAWRHL